MLLIIPLKFFDCLKCVILNLYSVSKTSILDTFIWVFCVIVLSYYSKNFGKMLNKIEDSRHPHHGLRFKLHFPYLTISVIFAVGICKNPLSHWGNSFLFLVWQFLLIMLFCVLIWSYHHLLVLKTIYCYFCFHLSENSFMVVWHRHKDFQMENGMNESPKTDPWSSEEWQE